MSEFCDCSRTALSSFFSTMISLGNACCGANQALSHALRWHSSGCSQTGWRSPVGRLFQLRWVWACPNDWEAGSNSCKLGSATRVEPLHLSLWIHICTVHSTNYYKPSARTFVRACVHWSTMNTSVVMLFSNSLAIYNPKRLHRLFCEWKWFHIQKCCQRSFCPHFLLQVMWLHNFLPQTTWFRWIYSAPSRSHRSAGSLVVKDSGAQCGVLGLNLSLYVSLSRLLRVSVRNSTANQPKTCFVLHSMGHFQKRTWRKHT